MMRGKSKSAQRARRLPMCAVAALDLWVAGCTSHSSYLGIPLGLGQADIELQQLASLARMGDKHAQLQLGIRFEEGRSVVRDLSKAHNLYSLAASDSGGPVWVYTPAVGNGTKGRMVSINRGPRQAGLVEARARLAALRRSREEN